MNARISDPTTSAARKVRLFGYFEHADMEGLERRSSFAFAARMSEIINMEWE